MMAMKAVRHIPLLLSLQTPGATKDRNPKKPTAQKIEATVTALIKVSVAPVAEETIRASALEPRNTRRTMRHNGSWPVLISKTIRRCTRIFECAAVQDGTQYTE
jgi:hypothetical protein